MIERSEQIAFYRTWYSAELFRVAAIPALRLFLQL